MYKVFIKNKPIFFIENDEDISTLDSQFVYSCDNKDDKEIVLDKHSGTSGRQKCADKSIGIPHA